MHNGQWSIEKTSGPVCDVHMAETGGAGYIYAVMKPQRLPIREIALLEREIWNLGTSTRVLFLLVSELI